MKTFSVLLGLALICGPLPASIIVYNSGLPDGVNSLDMTTGPVAENFTIAGPAVLNQLIFFGSATVDDVFSQFSGTIGFRILTDNAGAPGSSVALGSDASVVISDNHTQNSGTEEYQFSVNLGSIALNPGTYWLALHEGAMGTPSDGTPIYWDSTASVISATPQVTDDPNALIGYTIFDSSFPSLSFELISEPEPGTTGLFALGGAMIWFNRKRFMR